MFVLRKGNTFNRTIKADYPTGDKFTKVKLSVTFRLLTNHEFDELREQYGTKGREYARQMVTNTVKAVDASFPFQDEDGNEITDMEEKIAMLADDHTLSEAVAMEYINSIKKSTSGN